MYVISCEIQVGKIWGVGTGLTLGLLFASVDIRCRLLLKLLKNICVVIPA
jgi:hypothetical protein